MTDDTCPVCGKGDSESYVDDDTKTKRRRLNHRPCVHEMERRLMLDWQKRAEAERDELVAMLHSVYEDDYECPACEWDDWLADLRRRTRDA